MPRSLRPDSAGALPVPTMPANLENSDLPEELKLALKMRREGLQGFNSSENAALRSQMALQQQGTEAARKRALAQSLAKSGVRGGAAASAENRAQQLANQERAQQAQDLFVKNIAQKQKALGDFEQASGGALKTIQGQQYMGLAANLAKQQMDINKEIADKQAAAIKEYGWLQALGQQDDDQSRNTLNSYYSKKPI